ncbi:LPO_1073/Vpar_1526 family protein [Nocardioides szechwanensis]|uniref:LPO_1073/Vpar_1526 family protein n=1 Tax=Nocardioides szechwanensis TaxID=1005944 RepID=UPI00115FFC22|nr:LPO_1073/Vpar_1526 family protein [Nocardioides szechwanensis]
MVTPDDARAITDRQQAEAIRSAFTEEAQEVGGARAKQLRDRLVNQLAEEGLLSVFREPSFQALLARSAIGAAQTDEQTDYDLLANILADRARKGDERRRRIGLDRAVEVVEKVEISDLRALTTIFVLTKVRAMGGSLVRSLETHDALYGSLLGDSDLPLGRGFMDRLDLLNLVRVNQIGGFRKFDDYWIPTVSGWYASGIRKDDPMVDEVWTGFARRGFKPLLSEHELDAERWRLAYARPAYMREALVAAGKHTESQVDGIMDYASNWFGLNDSGDPVMRQQVVDRLDATATLGKVRRWLDSLPNGCFMTDAGVILARSYAEHRGLNKLVNNWERIDLTA